MSDATHSYDLVRARADGRFEVWLGLSADRDEEAQERFPDVTVRSRPCVTRIDALAPSLVFARKVLRLIAGSGYPVA